MQTRRPIVAGQFYPGQHDLCVDEINASLEQRTLSEQLPETIVAAIVPHAGWTFSGDLAALALSAVKHRHEKVHTFVVFGAAHSHFGPLPAIYDRGRWMTPLGAIVIDEELADAVADAGGGVSNRTVHDCEHSIEVQIPFIQYLFAGAKILPIIVPPAKQAVALGETLGDIIKTNTNKKIVCLASTDLTHYGPRYGFTPMGVGADAIRWASEVNDQKFIDLALKLDAPGLLTSAAEDNNACGAGAAAAAAAVARRLGKTKGLLLAHSNSDQVMQQKMHGSGTDSVGYAAIVF